MPVHKSSPERTKQIFGRGIIVPKGSSHDQKSRLVVRDSETDAASEKNIAQLLQRENDSKRHELDE